MSLLFSKKPLLTLTLIFSISAAVIFFLMGITYKHWEKLSNYNSQINQSLEISLQLEKLYTQIKNLETESTNYFFTGNQENVANIQQYHNNIIATIKQLKSAYQQYPKTIEKLDLTENLAQKLYNNTQSLTLEKKSNPKIYLQQNRQIADQIEKNIETLLLEKNDEHKTVKTYFFFAEKSASLYTYLLALFSLSLLAFAFFRIFKEMKRQKKLNAELQLAINVSKIAEEIGDYGVWRYHIAEKKYQFSDHQYRIFGYQPNQIKAEKGFFLQHTHPEDIAVVEKNLQNKHELEIMKPFHFRIISKDGKEKVLQCSARRIYLKEDEPILLGFTQDISEKVAIHKKLEIYNQNLEISNKELQSFNYVASHDLQEPLRKIETFISRITLDENRLSQNGKIFFDRIKVATHNMRTLIGDLLQYSKTNQFQQNFVKTDLNQMMQATLEELQIQIGETQTEINCDQLPVINVVPFQIQQLFSNLIGNSIKYRSEKNLRITITNQCVNARDDLWLKEKSAVGKFYKITFTDNGIGFESQFSEKIFDPFFRLHNKSDYQGTGVGLAICKKIIDNHHGYISAQSKIGEGAIFSIFLPTVPIVST